METAQRPSIFDGQAEGHCILLIEDSVDGPRTFSEYPSTYELQIALIRMYEEYREKVGIGSDLKNYLNWMDGFSRMEAFVFETKFGRYKQVSRAELKLEFEEANDAVPRIKNPTKNTCHKLQNGHSNMPTREELDRELELVAMEQVRRGYSASSDSEEEDWDK